MYNIIKQIKEEWGIKREMKKNIILMILLIVSVAGNILLYSRLKTSTTDNQNLNTTISEVQASMDNLENQISEVQADISDTNTKNEELQSENESLQSEIELLQAELEKLQATGLEETTVNNNSDSQSGSDVASEVQEPAQSNQVPQEQGDSDSNQSNNTSALEKQFQDVLNQFGSSGYAEGHGMRGDY